MLDIIFGKETISVASCSIINAKCSQRQFVQEIPSDATQAAMHNLCFEDLLCEKTSSNNHDSELVPSSL